jgi:hypothetical protein
MLFAAGLLLACLLPGALFSRLLFKRVEPTFAFLISILFLTLTLTALNILRLPCTLAIISSVFTPLCLLAAALLFWRDGAIMPRANLQSSLLRLKRNLRLLTMRPLFLTLALATTAILAAFVYKECLNPLPGYDASIRWEYLAARIFEQGHSDFYPPVTNTDFSLYALPDAMGMAVASQYWLAYALAGRANAMLCVPLVILQMAMILCAGASLARALGASRTGAALAVFLLATTGVVTTGTLIGQEVGLLTLAALLLLTFIRRYRTHPSTPLAIAIGLTAATAALTREYGGAYLLFALAACLFIRPQSTPRWRPALLMTIVFTLTAGPWLLHVWRLTGNPFYSIGFAGLFPKSPDLWAKLMAHNGRLAVANFPNWFSTPQPYACLLQSLPAFLGLFAAFKLRQRSAAWLLISFAVMMYILCIWGFFPSLGDLYYSHRVAIPGIAPLAVILAAWLATQIPRNRTLNLKAITFAIITLLTAHALLTLLVHYDYPWRSPAQWQTMATQPGLRGDRVYGYPIAARAFIEGDIATFNNNTILSADAYLQRALIGLPVRVVPPWSPLAAPVMDPSIPPLQVRRLLFDNDIRFILVNPSAPVEGTWQLNSPWFTADQENLNPRAPIADGIELRMIPPPAAPQ